MKRGLKRALKRMNLQNNTGWSYTGKNSGSDRLGFSAELPKASFTVTIPEAIESMHLVLISLKSYGRGWDNSELQITTQHPDSGKGLGVFHVAGYHEHTTSVSYSHKFLLDPSNLTVGKPVEARFDLVGLGYRFKIFGVMFCSH